MWRGRTVRRRCRTGGAALAGLEEGTLLSASGRAAGRRRLPEQMRAGAGRPLSAGLQALARRQAVTLNTVLQAAWALLLGRLTGRADVVFGVTVAGRPAELAGVERMVGLFINTLPLRVGLSPRAAGVVRCCGSCRSGQSGLMAHQHVGLAEIQQLAGRGRAVRHAAGVRELPGGRRGGWPATAAAGCGWCGCAATMRRIIR